LGIATPKNAGPNKAHHEASLAHQYASGPRAPDWDDRLRPCDVPLGGVGIAGASRSCLSSRSDAVTLICPRPISGRRDIRPRAREAKSLLSRVLLGARTSICNNVRRTDSSSLPRPCCRLGLQHARARDIAHSFFARFENHSARGGRHSISTASSGQQTTLPVWVGEHS
jgi:hypothetical protein